jgi:hypothetical protein
MTEAELLDIKYGVTQIKREHGSATVQVYGYRVLYILGRFNKGLCRKSLPFLL